jgi:internalin A
MPLLQTLYFGETQIVDLTPLEDTTAITVLNLEVGSVSDISSLAALTSLQLLEAGGNDIVDTSALGALTTLTFVGLSDNAIVDLTPLAQNLELSTTDVVDVTGNPFDCNGQDGNLTTLLGRGVQLYTDCP